MHVATTRTDPAPEIRGTRKYNGPDDAAELNRTVPCTITWCDHRCRWEADSIGGQIYRPHSRDRESGLEVSGPVETPPGEPEDPTEIGFFVNPMAAADGGGDMTGAEARQLVADLVEALAVIEAGAR